MPSPYDSKCGAYQGSSSATACFADCFSRRFKRRFNATSSDVPIPFLHVQQEPRVMEAPLDNDSQEWAKRARDLCRRLRHSDCHTDSYFARVLEEVDMDWGCWEMRVDRPQGETRVSYSPQITLMDLLLVLLNAAGFWFTFCPRHLLMRFAQLFVRDSGSTGQTQVIATAGLVSVQRPHVAH